MTSPQFGRKASQVSRGGGADRELYLVGFKDGKNLLTCAEADPNEWVETSEHFDNARRFGFPCAIFAGMERCMGCEWPVEHPEWTKEWIRDKAQNTDGMTRADRNAKDPGWKIREPSSKWFLRAINSEGYNRVYRIGWETYSKFKAFYDDPERGPLTNQVYEVKKTGSGLSTDHMVIPTGQAPYQAKYKMPSDAEIYDTLGRNYIKAFNTYVELGLVDESGRPTFEATEDNTETGDEAQAGPVPEQAAEPAAPSGDIVKDSLNQAKAAQAKKEQNPVHQAIASTQGELPRGITADTVLPENWDPQLNAREADSGDLKDWLDRHPLGAIEYPARAPRSVLVGLVEKSQLPF